MLIDWLIYLDLLEDYKYNTTFLRFVTPIIFGIIEAHTLTPFRYGCGLAYGYGNGNGNRNGNGFGYKNSINYQQNGCFELQYCHPNYYDEEH